MTPFYPASRMSFQAVDIDAANASAGEDMPTHLVNLDALIERISFDATTAKKKRSQQPDNRLKLNELDGGFGKMIRKPDFNRETCCWKPDTIADFIKSYAEHDVIPAVICWWAPDGTIMVIDGAHRLSVLLAWIHDDYGDRDKSQKFWDYQIPSKQNKLAAATRKLVEEKVGNYKTLKGIFEEPDNRDANALRLARDIFNFKIDITWIDGNADKAEASFFRINGSAAPIDPIELSVIRARKKPNALATRALMNVGAGYEYWREFSKENKNKIRDISKSVYAMLFEPAYKVPVKTPELPLAGSPYSSPAFRMILDMVNIVNDVTDSMWMFNHKKPDGDENTLPNETEGSATVGFMKKVEKTVMLLCADDESSLGLHPMVYCYGPSAKFQPPAFLATVKFFSELSRNKRLISFTEVRKHFEDFLINHRHFTVALAHAGGSRTRSLRPLLRMYEIILECAKNGVIDHNKIAKTLLAEKSLYALKSAKKTIHYPKKRKGTFHNDAKGHSILEEVVNAPLLCKICGSRLHPNSMSADHIKRRRDGGDSTVKNLQWSHPFCNSGYREHKDALKKRTAKNETLKPKISKRPIDNKRIPRDAKNSRSPKAPVVGPETEKV
jgi:5-methylcytosine-specific restriction endonuclease McrA